MKVEIVGRAPIKLAPGVHLIYGPNAESGIAISSPTIIFSVKDQLFGEIYFFGIRQKATTEHKSHHRITTPHSH
jgi:hypothetical protein